MSTQGLTAADYAQSKREDARLVMLRALADQDDDHLNQTLLLQTLKAFGYRVDKNFVQTELRVMRDLGAVILHEVGGFMTAEITTAGTRHVAREIVISGIPRPSRREG